MVTDTIKRPAIRYYGGKWRLSDWIISHFPNHKVYTEAFFGGGSVLFRKKTVSIETVNDMDADVVNFFRVLRNQENELLRLISLTPWSRDEINSWKEELSESPIERARIFWAKSWMTIGQNNYSFRISKRPKAQPARIMRELDYLHEVSDRLKGVQIESMDALEFLPKYDDVDALHYVDPPYLYRTRGGERYRLDAGDTLFHERLSGILNELQGMVVMSCYDDTIYNELYKGWHKFKCESLANSGTAKTETLYLNKLAISGLKGKMSLTEPAQATLF